MYFHSVVVSFRKYWRAVHLQSSQVRPHFCKAGIFLSLAERENWDWTQKHNAEGEAVFRANITLRIASDEEDEDVARPGGLDGLGGRAAGEWAVLRGLRSHARP